MNKHAPFASDPAHSLGRVHETGQSRTRSEFQRDRDRIIHSTAFRRLQHKTQVFLHHEGQHFRTRLTHTLEVSQVSRSIARALSLDEDLAEAIALAHDLGHTPFGHAGERVLNDKMSAWGGFDHNVQGLRTVTLLENRYATHDGLNLTWETLEGMLKHNGPLTDKNGKAIGKYVVEGLPFGLQDIPASADLQIHTHASLEAQVAAIADDIAYNAHDIDDAIRAGILDLQQLRDVPLVGPIVTEVLEKWPDISPSRQTHEVQRRLITFTIEDAIDTSIANLAVAAPKNADDVRHAGKTLVTFSSELAKTELLLKQFMFENVYRADQVMQHVHQSEQVVAALFDRLMQSADMPEEWSNAAQMAKSDAARARIVCDFIAGMTDPYALDLYQSLFDARPDFR